MEHCSTARRLSHITTPYGGWLPHVRLRQVHVKSMLYICPNSAEAVMHHMHDRSIAADVTANICCRINNVRPISVHEDELQRAVPRVRVELEPSMQPAARTRTPAAAPRRRGP
jgi:hypothetical protein